MQTAASSGLCPVLPGSVEAGQMDRMIASPLGFQAGRLLYLRRQKAFLEASLLFLYLLSNPS